MGSKTYLTLEEIKWSAIKSRALLNEFRGRPANLAASLGISRAALYRLFRKHGYPPGWGDYAKDIRIDSILRSKGLVTEEPCDLLPRGDV